MYSAKIKDINGQLVLELKRNGKIQTLPIDEERAELILESGFSAIEDPRFYKTYAPKSDIDELLDTYLKNEERSDIKAKLFDNVITKIKDETLERPAKAIAKSIKDETLDDETLERTAKAIAKSFKELGVDPKTTTLQQLVTIPDSDPKTNSKLETLTLAIDGLITKLNEVNIPANSNDTVIKLLKKLDNTDKLVKSIAEVNESIRGLPIAEAVEKGNEKVVDKIVELIEKIEIPIDYATTLDEIKTSLTGLVDPSEVRNQEYEALRQEYLKNQNDMEKEKKEVEFDDVENIFKHDEEGLTTPRSTTSAPQYVPINDLSNSTPRPSDLFKKTIGKQNFKITQKEIDTVMMLKNPETGYVDASKDNVKKVFGNEKEFKELEEIFGTVKNRDDTTRLNYSKLSAIAKRINDINFPAKKIAWNSSTNINSGKGLKNLMKRYVK